MGIGRAKVYIADASIQISNTANVYKIVKSFSLEDAWIKGPVMILNSFFIMCEGLKGRLLAFPELLLKFMNLSIFIEFDQLRVGMRAYER